MNAFSNFYNNVKDRIIHGVSGKKSDRKKAGGCKERAEYEAVLAGGGDIEVNVENAAFPSVKGRKPIRGHDPKIQKDSKFGQNLDEQLLLTEFYHQDLLAEDPSGDENDDIDSDHHRKQKKKRQHRNQLTAATHGHENKKRRFASDEIEPLTKTESKPGENMDEQFTKLNRLGQGTYGVVFKAKETATGKFVAIKRMLVNQNGTGVSATTIREISTLKTLNHPNIIQLAFSQLHLGFMLDRVICSNQYIYAVFELMEMDLGAYLKSMHGRDFPVGQIKVVTLWYRAPELLLGCEVYKPALDMWSIGCIFAELLDRRALFPGDSEIHELFLIFQVLGTPDEKSWPPVKYFRFYQHKFPKWKSRSLDEVLPKITPAGHDLLSQMLCYDDSVRISAKSAVSHYYFSHVMSEIPLAVPGGESSQDTEILPSTARGGDPHKTVKLKTTAQLCLGGPGGIKRKKLTAPGTSHSGGGQGLRNGKRRNAQLSSKPGFVDQIEL